MAAKNEDVVAVVAFNTAGFVAAVTSCDRCDAQKYAAYYRRYYKSVKAMTYAEFGEQQEKEWLERHHAIL